MVTVECDDCMVTTWTYGDAHEAIAAWNRRASPDEHLLRQAAEALEDVVGWVPGSNWHADAPLESVKRARKIAAALRQRMGGTK
jgi:hypothetical protein